MAAIRGISGILKADRTGRGRCRLPVPLIIHRSTYVSENAMTFADQKLLALSLKGDRLRGMRLLRRQQALGHRQTVGRGWSNTMPVLPCHRAVYKPPNLPSPAASLPRGGPLVDLYLIGVSMFERYKGHSPGPKL